jgi:cysteine-rich repeat protein
MRRCVLFLGILAGPACAFDASGVGDDEGSTGAEPTSGVDGDALGLLVCGDAVCGRGEAVESCPRDCNVCGDGVVFGSEACDNGINEDPAYAVGVRAEACTAECRLVASCGDGVQNGPEQCDAGGAQTAECEADCRAPVCGDGVFNSDAGEGCDDANAVEGDGCSPDCERERRVFVTSFELSGDFEPIESNPEDLRGIALADLRCNQRAERAGLPGVYKAWLADFTTEPADRFDTAFEGLYRLPTPEAQVVARSWRDLVDGELLHPIVADEHGETMLARVWTSTTSNGLVASSDHCMNWSKSAWSIEVFATTGVSWATDAAWTSDGEAACAEAHAFYCFEDR